MQLLKAKEVCNMLNISMSTLDRWRKDCNVKFPMPIKARGVNDKPLWVESDIEEWVKENK